LSRAVRAASLEDTADAMELAAMSGQLAVVGDVVYGLQMRSLGIFLAAMSSRLKAHAARELVQARSRQELAEAMGSVGELVAGLGANEVEEGVLRMVAAEELEIASSEMAQKGAAELAEGLANLEASDTLAEMGGQVAAAGVEKIASGGKAAAKPKK
jgi:hypothetical protein